MKDLTSSAWMWVKALLLLSIGAVSSMLIFFEAPSFRMGLLLCLTIWGFCRAYYFAFYVIEKYVDSGYRFSGLISFCRYLLKKPQPDPVPRPERDAGTH
jgi:hypothetical protein